VPTEPAPKVNVPKTDVPFLDAEAIADPDEVRVANDFDPETVGVYPEAPPALEPHAGPCADCARYARIGYVAGVVVGVSAGALVAYVILRNRLAPVAE